MSKTFILITALGLTLMPTLSQAKATQWKGTWKNKKHSTSGMITLTIPADQKEGTWDATFKAEFRGEWNSYPVKIQATPDGSKIKLKGTATLGRDQYTWSGYVTDAILNAKFKAKGGNNGTFKLKPAKTKSSGNQQAKKQKLVL